MIYFIIWSIIFIISIFIELLSPGLFFFLSFSIGAALSAILSLISDNLIFQIIGFIIFSTISFIMLKYWLHKENKEATHNTNVYALIGKIGTAFEHISLNKKGFIKINGEIWSARGLNNEHIEQGELVEVVAAKGAHLIIKKINK